MVRTIKGGGDLPIKKIDINKYTVYSKKLQPTHNGNDAHNIPNKDTLLQTAKKLKTELLYEQDTQKQQILHQKIYEINTDLNTISQIEARVATELPPVDNETYLQYKRKLAEDEYADEYVKGVVKTEKIKVQEIKIEKQEEVIEEQEEEIVINATCQALQNSIRVCEYGEKKWTRAKEVAWEAIYLVLDEPQVKAELDTLQKRITTCVEELQTAVRNLPNKINYSNKGEYKDAYAKCRIKWAAWKGKYGFRKLNHIWVKYSGIKDYNIVYWKDIGAIITDLVNKMDDTVEIFNLHLALNRKSKLQNVIGDIIDTTNKVNSFYNTIDRTSITKYSDRLTLFSTELKKLKNKMPRNKNEYQQFISSIVNHNKIGISTNITTEYDNIILLIDNISNQFNREIRIYNDLRNVKQEYDTRTNQADNIDTFLKTRVPPIGTAPIQADVQTEDEIKNAMYEIQTKYINRKKRVMSWGTTPTTLPEITGGGSYQCTYFTIILFVILIVLIIILIYVIYVINNNKYNTNYIPI